MATAREKPWTIEELAEWLGYADIPRALEIVRDQGIPYLFLGPRGKKFGDPGSHRYLRFLPSRVEAWALAASVTNEPAPAPEAPATEGAAPRPQPGGWRSSAPKPKLRGPRAAR